MQCKAQHDCRQHKTLITPRTTLIAERSRERKNPSRCFATILCLGVSGKTKCASLRLNAGARNNRKQNQSQKAKQKEKTKMKKTNNTTRNKKLLRIGSLGLILSILFVFVFAGVLSASFAVENIAIENGLIDANVASAWTAPGVSGSTFAVTGNDHQGSVTAIASANSATLTATKKTSFTDYASNDSANGEGYYGETWRDATRSLIMFETYKITDANIVQAINLGLVDFSLSMSLKSGTENRVTSASLTTSVFVSVGTASNDDNAKSNGGTWSQVASNYCDASVSGTNNYSSRTCNVSAFTPNSSSVNDKSTYYVRVGITTKMYVEWVVYAARPKVQVNVESYTLMLKLKTATANFTGTPTGTGTGSPTSGTITTFSGSTSSVATSADNGYHPNGTWTGGTGTLSTSGNTLTVYLKNFTSATTTFTASFDINKKKVKYNNNGGSGSVSDTQLEYNKSATLSNGSGMSRTDYILVGWATTSTATTATYSLSHSVTAAMTKQTGTFDLRAVSTHENDVTLYAVWKQSDFGALAGKSKTDGTWGSESNPFVISTQQHLTNLAALVNADLSVNAKPALDSVTGCSFQNVTTQASKDNSTNSITFAGCYFEIAANLTNNAQFVPIGKYSSNPFKGTIKGKSGGTQYTITLSISGSSSGFQGLFGYINGATLEDVAVAGSVNITGQDYVGGVAAYAVGSTFTRCTNAATVQGKNYIGGIAGYAENCTFANCTNNSTGVSIIATANNAGGIVGYLKGGTVTSANNTKSVQGVQWVGGIIGRVENAVTINGATNSGSVKTRTGSGDSNRCIGGIVGGTQNNATSPLTLSGTISNSGNVCDDVITRATGGIVGYSGSNLTISNSATITNTGTIGRTNDANTRIGGIVGAIAGTQGGAITIGSATITNNGFVRASSSGNEIGGVFGVYAPGTDAGTRSVSVDSSAVFVNQKAVSGGAATGGIIGKITFISGVDFTLYNCTNTGTITGSNNVGGIVGNGNGFVKVSASKNSGTINGSNNVGGIVGYATSAAASRIAISHCFNQGQIVVNTAAGGGIIGNLSTTSATTIEYCASTAQVSGTGSSKGTIIGLKNAASSPNVKFNHCFGLSDDQGFSGSAIKSGNTQYLNATGCWNFFTTTSVSSAVPNYNSKYAVVDALSYVWPSINNSSTPAAPENNYAYTEDLNTRWARIINQNIDGFIVALTVNDGKYFSARTSADTTVNDNYFTTPTAIINPYVNSGDVVRVDYKDNIGGDVLYCTAATPTTSQADGYQYVYNAEAQGTTVTVPATSPYTITYLYTGKYLNPANGAETNHSSATAPTNVSKDGESYTMSADVKLGGSKVGHIARTFRIKKREIKVTYTWTDNSANPSYATQRDRSNAADHFIYNGSAQGLYSITVTNMPVGASSKTIHSKTSINLDVFNSRGSGDFNITDSGNEAVRTFTITLLEEVAYNCTLVDVGNAEIGASCTWTYVIDRLAIDDTQFILGYRGTVANMPHAHLYDHAPSANQYVIDGTSTNDWALNYSATQATAEGYQTTRPALVYRGNGQRPSAFFLVFSAGGTGVGALATFNINIVTSALNRTVDGVSMPEVAEDGSTHVPTNDVVLRLDGTGNFKGSMYVCYKLTLTDFGYDPAKINDGNWGSEQNPFLISDILHLIRLTQIVNGESEPWNSTELVNAEQVQNSIVGSNYQNAYFKLTTNLDVPANSGFKPIGNLSGYSFAGTFDGDRNTLTLHMTTSNVANVGLFGYVEGVSNNKAIIKNLTVAGSVTAGGSGNNNVGGLVGYGTHVLFDNVATATGMTVSGANNVGGVIGYAGAGTVFTYDSASATHTQNRATVSGTNYVGGIVGQSVVSVESATNSGAVSGAGWVGGIAGVISSASLKKVDNTAGVSATGNYVGGLVGKLVLSAPFEAVSSSGTVGGGNMVGGYFGWLSGSVTQTLEGADTSAAVSGNGSVGYVGGLVGYVNLTDFIIKDSTRNGTVIAENGSRVGGFVGYGSNVHFVNSSNVTASLSNVTNDKRVQGVNYVGGLAGELSVLNITDGNVANILSGIMTPSCTGASASNIDSDSKVSTDVWGSGEYVGGFVGKFYTSETINLTPVMRRSFDTTYDTKATRSKVAGLGFVGAIFGYVKGNGYHESASGYHESKIIIDKTGDNPNVVAWVQNTGSGNVIGGLVGYASGVAIYVAKDISTGYFFKSSTFDVSDNGGQFTVSATTGTNRTNYFGGLVGVLGANATIVAATANGDGGIYKVWADTTVSADVAGNYVGGVVGFVTARAGVYLDANTTLFGDSVGFEHNRNGSYGPIAANGDYVGGIIGFMGIGSNSTSVSLPSAISDDLAANGNVVRFDPRYGTTANRKGFVQNQSNVTGANYVGGLIGCVGASDTLTEGARVQFENGTINGTWTSMQQDVAVFSANDALTIKGTNNVGGLIGALAGNRNSSELKRVFADATTANATNGVTGVSNVGGLVGRIDNGTIENCFFAKLTNGAYTQDRIYGSGNAVGGLVGLMNGGELKHSVGMAYMLSSCTETKGGVIGTKLGGTLTDSWAIYYKADAEYTDAVDNSRGKGIIITTSQGVTTKTPTFAEVAQMVGLVVNAITTNATTELAGEEEYVSVAIGLPTAQTVSSVRHDYYLVFYVATGVYETYPVSNFADKNSTGDVVYIKHSMASASFSICTKEVLFSGIEKVQTTGTDAQKLADAKTKVAAAFKTPAADDNYKVKVNNATYNTTTYYVTGADGFVYIGAEAFKVGNYVKTIIVGSSETPYLISSEADWYQFAINIRLDSNQTAPDGNSYTKQFSSYSSADYISYASSSFKLTKDLTLGNVNKYQLAGDPGNISSNGTFTSNGDRYAFKGTFDGDGHTISFNYSASSSSNYTIAQASLFPNASGATFKNLTISGTIDAIDGSIGTTTSGTYSGSDEVAVVGSGAGNARYSASGYQLGAYNVAGFVGYPYGNVTFVNCTNAVNVEAWRDAGGFVGASSQSVTVTIIDCVNDGTITTYDAGTPFDSQDGVSESDTSINWQHGTGGFIGNADGTSILDSCRNKKAVKGGQNVGGIVGRTTKSLEIYNCANTGDITAHSGYTKESAITSDAKNQSGTRNWLNYAGGILGKASRYNTSVKAATVKIYASYNSATVTAYGNVAGGIVGSIGDLYPSKRGVSQELLDSWVGVFAWLAREIGGEGNNADNTSASGESVIAYCYNTGTVQTGGTSKKKAEAWGAKRTAMMTGTIAGGIVGIFGAGTVSYCYNTGTITSWGIDGFSFEWHTRVGGIVAQAQPTSPYSATINHCYNVGLVRSMVGSGSSEFSGGINILGAGTNLNQGDIMYGGQILGYIEDPAFTYAKAHTSVTDCYSLTGKFYNANYSSPSSREYGVDAFEYENTVLSIHVVYIRPNVHNCSSGVVCTLDELTAVMNNNGVVAPSGKFVNGGTAYNVSNPKGNSSGETITYSGNGNQSGAGTLVLSNGNDIKSFNESTFTPTYSNDTGFKSGTAFGWIYVYGCLPQLAVFALGTKKGMSMLATSYGRNTDGDFVAQQAGGEFSPYIIKDGIHLLGVTALTSADKNNIYYDFHNKYIEFVAADNNIDGTVVQAIHMPTSATDTQAYKGASTQAGTASVTSKSYHIFSLGAAYYENSQNTTNALRTAWQNKNYYFDGTNSGGSIPTQLSHLLHSGATIATSQFWPISSTGHKTVFRGNLDAHGGIVRGLNLSYGSTGSLELGVFTKLENATIKNLGVTGSITAYTYGTGALEYVAVGAIAGRIGNGTTIDGCFAGTTSNKLTITAQSKNAQPGIALNPSAYVGGIVGVADTIGFNASGVAQSVSGGASTIIRSETRNADVYTFKSNVGGIVGYATSSQNATGTTVNITDCKVLGATIQTTANSNDNAALGTNAGGIIGTHDSQVLLNITGCEVGLNTQKSPTTAKVTIKGENSIGGVIGSASRYLKITDTKVFGDVKIQRANSWGTVLNHTSYNTAIGGLVGYTPTSVAGNAPNIILGGTLLFAGEIDAAQATSSGANQSIGGIAGFLGAGTNFASGAQIYIVGKIGAGSISNVKNIGGVVGEVANAAFSGTFYVAPTMNVSTATQVGGFIGTATGNCTILADNTDIHIGGNIAAKQYVGGFIGIIGSASALDIGPATYNGVDYSKDVTITIHGSAFNTKTAATYITAQAVEYDITCQAAAISASQNDVGGIVGNNSGSGAGKGVNIYKGTIVNGGAVSSTLASGETNVGGIIGNNNGALTIASAATVSNSGSVTGKDYVGGIIGKMMQGSLAGSFINGVENNASVGQVRGANFVGGSIGFMANGTSITASGAQTTFTNHGNVTGTGSYVGGSIGAMLGSITGSNSGTLYRVKFINKGAVNGVDFLGGSIGVLAGGATWASFVNNGAVTSSGSVAIGGSIGVIGLPVSGTISSLSHDAIVYQNNHAEYNSTLGLTVNTGSAQTASSGAAAAVAGHGGVGGVIGVIKSDVGWSGDNSFYVAGDVSATDVDNVGGTIGLVLKDGLAIDDLLAYDTLVEGRNNVGGIVGAVNASGVTIANSFNVTINNTTKGVNGDAQVGGIVGYADNSTIANTSYWVKGYHNDELASLDIDSLQTDLGKYKTISSNDLKAAYKSIVGADINITGELINLYETPNEFREGLIVSENESDNTWANFLTSTYFNIPSGYSIDAEKCVFQKTSFTPYTTGTEHTGYYFVYSNDMREDPSDASSALLINTIYSDSAMVGSRNLDFWKYIANNYSDGETKPTTGLNSSIIYDTVNEQYTGGGKLTENDNGDRLHVVAAGSTTSGYYLYIASTGELTAYGTKMVSDTSKVHIFVQADKSDDEGNGAPAKNVVIYYRSIGVGKDLDYNGYARYAPLSVPDSEIPYSRNETIAETTYDEAYTYCTYAQGMVDTGRHVVAGTYSNTVKIFYVSGGELYQMGFIENMEWKIKAHSADVSVTASSTARYGATGSYDGTGSTSGLRNDVNSITVVVKGIANKDTSNAGNFVEFAFTITDEKTGAAYAINVNPAYYNTTNSVVTANLGLDSTKVLVTYGTSPASTAFAASVIPTNDSSENKSKAYSDAEKRDHNYDDLNAADPAPVWNTYQFVFHFRNANTTGYRISVSLVDHQSFANAANVSTTCYSTKGTSSALLRINPISLKTAAGPTDSADYTGDVHENNFWVGKDSGTTWANVADAQEVLPQFGMSIVYLDKDGNKVSDVEIQGAGTASVSATGYAMSVVGASGFYCTFTISNFQNRGSYYIKFSELEVGNYKINAPASDPQDGTWKTIDGKKCLRVFGITENKITITWGGPTSKVYDGEVISDVTVTIASDPSKQVMTNMMSVINDMFDFYVGGDKITPELTGSTASVSGRTLTIRAGFFKSKSDQAGSYSFSIKGNSTDNVTIDYEHSNGTKGEDSGTKFTRRSYTISKAPLTVAMTTYTTGMSDGASREYNTSHQGIQTITISGLIAKDTIDLSSKSARKAKIIVNLVKGSAAVGTSSISDSGNNKTSGKISVSNCIDAGSYTCSVNIDSNNYTLTGVTTTSWTITQHTISSFAFSGGSSVEYDGKAHVPELTIDGASVSNGQFTYYGDTITVNLVYAGGTGSGEMKNAGLYTISVNSSSKFTAKRTGTNTDTTSNYRFNASTGSASFEITQAPLVIDFQDVSNNSFGVGTSTPITYTYNGTRQGVAKAVVSGFKNGETLTSDRVATFTLTNLTGSASGSTYTIDPTVNVVPDTTYTLSVASGDHTSATYNLYNYYISAETSSISSSWTINPLAIVTTDWNRTGTAGTPPVDCYYLYTGAEISPTILSITLGGNAVTTPATTTYDEDDDLFLTTFYGPYTEGQENEKEKVIIEISEASGGNRTDVDDYTAHVAGFRVSGKNQAGATITDNYSFSAGAQVADCDYHITPGVVAITITGPTISKTYDGNTTTPTQRPTFTLTLNGTPLDENLVKFYKNETGNDNENVGTYDTKDVDTNKTVSYWARLEDGGNYAFSWSKTGESEPQVDYKLNVSAAIGAITAKEVTITLNLRNKTAYKTYDGTVKYAEWKNSASGNEGKRSDNYRAGQGFTVSGVLNETANTVNILAEIYEASDDSDRTGTNGFDAYVNNVYKSGDNYLIGGKTKATTFYKKLVFTIDGDNSSNYKYTIAGGGSEFVTNIGHQSGETTLTIPLYDSSNTANATGQSGEIHIAINKKTITANYSPLTQSYANADNTFNTDWVAITGTLSGLAPADSSVSVEVTNNWMYKDYDSAQGPATYDHYTTFTGREGNSVLGARLVGSKGKELNYALRKQPTLVIGYFVVKDGYYEVGSMAGLMLATYYYRMNFVDTETTGDGINVVPTELVWHSLATDAEYSSGTGYPNDYESWEEYFNAMVAEYNDGKAEEDQVEWIYNETSDSWGYWMPQAIARTSYLKFMQVKNIDGTLSSSDMLILEGQFGANWQTYVPNFVTSSAGDVVTAVGAFFETQDVVTARDTQGNPTATMSVPFIGEYKGAGYTINHVNLVGYAPISATPATFNVGMFEEVGSATVTTAGGKVVSGMGVVSGVNLRNWSVSFNDYNSASNTLNLGGIVGLSKQAQTLDESSFHGIINVYSLNGTLNVGGLVGKYDGTDIAEHNAIDGALAVGNMYVTAQDVNAGGIVGNLASTNCAINNVASMMGIFSTANGSNTIGGLIGTTTWLDKANALTTSGGKQNAYVTDSVVDMSNGSAVNKQVGNGSDVAGVTYTTLMSGSTSAYDSGNGNKYLGSSNTTTPGRYDMIQDRTVASSAMYESPRLKDVIMVYVLQYGLNTTTATVDTVSGVSVYAISTTSKLVGTALGTDGSKISINNQQQVAYLREFRFASFNLERDVDMYNLYSTSPFEGAFYGSVTANGHTINLRSSSQAKMFKVELSGHVVPVSKDA